MKSTFNLFEAALPQFRLVRHVFTEQLAPPPVLQPAKIKKFA